MSNFTNIEPSYLSKEGCRLIWKEVNEDEQHVVLLNKEEFEQLIEFLKNNNSGTVKLEDNFSEILINSDVTQFRLKDRDQLEVDTSELRTQVLEYAKVPHEPLYVQVPSKEFYPSISVHKDETTKSKEKTLLDVILSTKETVSESDLFRVMSTRRSTRKFTKTKVEDWKIEKILAAADTAPSAGNFQGLEVFYIKDKNAKEALIEAANNQPYVNAPLVLVFCMNPKRVKIKFPPQMLEKFSLQDATIAAVYSQLASSALGLSSIWIGMIDEEKVKKILGTDLRPSSILCIGYAAAKKPPKPRRNLKDLIHVLEN